MYFQDETKGFWQTNLNQQVSPSTSSAAKPTACFNVNIVTSKQEAAMVCTSTPSAC